MGGLVSGYPTNMCKSPVRVYAAPQPSTQGQMWIAQGPPLVGIHLSLAVPVPPGQEQEPHLSLCITDGLEVRQSALWGRAGQVAKKTRACQRRFLPAKAAATSFLQRWAGSASLTTAGDGWEQMALLGPDSSQIAREVWVERQGWRQE